MHIILHTRKERAAMFAFVAADAYGIDAGGNSGFR